MRDVQASPWCGGCLSITWESAWTLQPYLCLQSTCRCWRWWKAEVRGNGPSGKAGEEPRETWASERPGTEESIWAKYELAAFPRTMPKRPPLNIHGGQRCSAAGEGDKPCSTWEAACRQLLRGRRVSLGAALRESRLVLVVGTVPERDLPSLWHGSNLRSQGLREIRTLHWLNSKHNPRGLSWAVV